MRNILKATTLENKFPLFTVENGCIVSKDADITVAFRVELPELFTVTAAEYEAIHSAWNKAVKVLPDYSIVHKQDWFIKENYAPDIQKDDLSFLSRSFERHFNERPFLNHTCYLFLTKTTKERSRMQSNFSTLCRGFLVPKEIKDKETVTKFLEAVGQFESIMNDSGFITLTRLNSDEITGTRETAGIVEKYFSLSQTDTTTLKVSVKVGWCAETQKLYFLYEAYDNYWRFSENSLNTDIFEVVVDGDCSGGPFIDRFHPTAPKDVWQAWFKFHGCHAQNYHIFTPAHGNDWCMLWGPQVWLKQKPYADYAYQYSFKEGEAGKLVLEFYITPFDHADADGPELSRPTLLKEGNEIGLCWAVIDSDAHPASKDGIWNLTDEHTMNGNASYLRKFKLMPIQ